MPVGTSKMHILERLICEHISHSCESVAPRILVVRESTVLSRFAHHLPHAAKTLGCSLLPLPHTDEVVDWTPVFYLDSKANRVKRYAIELEFAAYCDLRRNSHDQIVFSFSIPYPTNDGHLMYFGTDRGFLGGTRSLCRFRGTFDAPTTHELIHLSQS